ncbi:MAG: tetratricopeptide repeat protein [Bacteroidota bacterium]
MKKVLLTYALLFIIKTITAQDSASLLQQAADAYTNADYQTAIDHYELILASGQYAFEVYYNLGNAYFKQEELAAAILNYERAARINPADTDLQYNLALAQSRTIDNIDMLPVPDLVSGYQSFVNTTAADNWGAFSVLAFVLLLASILTFLYVKKRWLKQVLLGTSGLLLLLSLLFFFFGWQQSNWLDSRKEAIIFQPSITVTSTPDDAGEELFVLHAGTKVRIVERFRNWVRIQIGDGNTGWIEQPAIREI